MVLRKAIRVTLGLIGALIILYIGILIFHKQIIFQATPLELSYDYQFDYPFEEYYVSKPGGEVLNALLFTSGNSPKGLILYFHGNADNLQRWGEYAIDFTTLGYDVLVVDYEGYGKSTGNPSEESLYTDAEVIWQWSHHSFNYDKYILYGRSLGSAVASHLAKETDPDLLILETPFDKIMQNIPEILIPESLENIFSNTAHLPDISTDIVIIQGDMDRLTKLSSAKKLIPLLKPDDEFVIIPGGRHKNLREFSEFHDTLKRIL